MIITSYITILFKKGKCLNVGVGVGVDKPLYSK